MALSPTTSMGPRARRRSSHINRKQATTAAPALRLAERHGTPLNWFVTLNFAHTACSPDDVSAAFMHLRDNYFSPWFRRPGRAYRGPRAPAAFLWVIENTGGHVAAHWLLHLPDDRVADFRARLPVWLKKTTGAVYCEVSAIDIRRANNPQGARKYMLKGIDPAYAAFYGIEHRPQGIVVGKRFGFSRSLGPSACRAARTYWSQIQQDRRAARR